MSAAKSSSPQRRTVLQAAGWAVPAVVAMSAAPALAASPTCSNTDRFGFSWTQLASGSYANGAELIATQESGSPIGKPITMRVTSRFENPQTLPVARYNMKVGRMAGSDDPKWKDEAGGMDWKIQATTKDCLVLNQYCKVASDDSSPYSDHIGGYTYKKDLDTWGWPLQRVTLTFSEPVTYLMVPIIDLTSADQGGTGGLLYWMRYTDIVWFETDTKALPDTWTGDTNGFYVTRKDYSGRYANIGAPGSAVNPFYRVGAASDYGDWQSNGGGVTGNDWKPTPAPTENRNVFFQWNSGAPVQTVHIYYGGQHPIPGNKRDYFYTNAQYIGIGDITFRRLCK